MRNNAIVSTSIFSFQCIPFEYPGRVLWGNKKDTANTFISLLSRRKRRNGFEFTQSWFEFESFLSRHHFLISILDPLPRSPAFRACLLSWLFLKNKVLTKVIRQRIIKDNQFFPEIGNQRLPFKIIYFTWRMT